MASAFLIAKAANKSLADITSPPYQANRHGLIAGAMRTGSDGNANRDGVVEAAVSNATRGCPLKRGGAALQA